MKEHAKRRCCTWLRERCQVRRRGLSETFQTPIKFTRLPILPSVGNAVHLPATRLGRTAGGQVVSPFPPSRAPHPGRRDTRGTVYPTDVRTPFLCRQATSPIPLLGRKLYAFRARSILTVQRYFPCAFSCGQCYVAHAGDSRCVLCRAGRAVQLTRDHKPGIPSEYARILVSPSAFLGPRDSFASRQHFFGLERTLRIQV